ncbi:Tn3 family transposase [Kitasatospora misakiensis]|uniref:Tn3 family transposase n=1 Tax=Kitasatospora misakiensis TaxID=67330 RepID=A0ABW0WXK9_9ACTN
MPLIDMLKEAILRTGCLKAITSVAGSRTLPEEVLAERLMLAIHAYGTARYLRDRALQREIEEGLNVVEAWNRANAVIYHGKGGEISSNRREEVEMAAQLAMASSVRARCSRSRTAGSFGQRRNSVV